jgi:CubicO group peptidase (beta-lactamase class C family)
VSDAAERAAFEYAERHNLHAFLVLRGGTLSYARYGAGYTSSKPHALYSGTKTFWGVLAAAAQDDGLLTLDEPVADTIPEWRHDPRKALVTLRQLLNLTAGFGFGGLGTAVPGYAKALSLELKTEPGETFAYGGIALQAFGAVLSRKLEPRGQTPHEYLRERVLGPIGLNIDSWRTLKDGTHPLPTGAFVAAREWLKFGLLLARGGVHDGASVVSPDGFAEVVQPSAANPRYGLAVWIHAAPDGSQVFYASGAGGQGLYALPERDVVIVRFGEGTSYKHDAFLARLLGT